MQGAIAARIATRGGVTGAANSAPADAMADGSVLEAVLQSTDRASAHGRGAGCTRHVRCRSGSHRMHLALLCFLFPPQEPSPARWPDAPEQDALEYAISLQVDLDHRRLDGTV